LLVQQELLVQVPLVWLVLELPVQLRQKKAL
jgi:hypothetical protein